MEDRVLLRSFNELGPKWSQIGTRSHIETLNVNALI